MHLLVPFAAPASDAGRQALRGVRWPQLERLLALGGHVQRHLGDGTSSSMPHERALARAWGLADAPDGQVPVAAWLAWRAGLACGPKAWGLLSPTHWRVDTEEMTLEDPAALKLDPAVSRGLFDAVRAHLEPEGFELAWVAADQWLLAHDGLAGLPTASLDRVVGRAVGPWLVQGPGAGAATAPLARWHRLQNELQMLLHSHPANAERESQGRWPVNSVWLSGCGVAPEAGFEAGPTVDDRLRAPALAEDWDAWQQAAAALDAGPLAELLGAAREGRRVRLTLCGESGAVELDFAARGLRARLAGLWRRPDALALLESL